MESKKQKFERLANARVNKALKQLDLISNLSNRSTYDYSQADAEQIIFSLERKVRELQAEFSKKLMDEQFRL